MNAFFTCVMVGLLCQASTFALEEKTAKSLETDPDPAEICNDCKVFFGDVAEIVEDDRTKTAATENAIAYICGRITNTRLFNVCAFPIKTIIPAILQLIADNIEPAEICDIIEFCSESGDGQSSVSKVREVIQMLKGNLKG